MIGQPQRYTLLPYPTPSRSAYDTSLFFHRSRTGKAELGAPSTTDDFAQVAEACARGTEDLSSRGLLEEGRKKLRLFSTWEITKYLIPVAPAHFRRVLRQNPDLPQGVSETVGGAKWFTLDEVLRLRAHFAAEGSKAKDYLPYRPEGVPAKIVAVANFKGGVGKTTVSCAIALAQAQQQPDEQVLLLSTDPAHSLGDVLLLPVDDEARSHPDAANLRVRALDAEALLQAFKADYGSVLETLVERGSFVEDDDLSPVWDMDWPGLNELMGLLEIQRILRAGEADRVIVDMAPSGHTLNLFGLMDFLDTLLQSRRLFQDKHRYMIEALSKTKGNDPDDADTF